MKKFYIYVGNLQQALPAEGKPYEKGRDAYVDGAMKQNGGIGFVLGDVVPLPILFQCFQKRNQVSFLLPLGFT